MADNVSAVPNAVTYPDWVELHNTSTNDIDLTDWSLSDDSDARKFVFPENTLITAGGFLVVWCDTNASLPGLHAGFMLNRDGETVSLFNAVTSRVDALTFGLQLLDYSVGRVGSDWILTTPTPNAANIAAPTASQNNVVINEWLANAARGGSDWLELFNRADQPIPLRGAWLTTGNDASQIQSLSFLAAHGHVQLFADEKAGVDHLNFHLPAEGGAIAFYDSTPTVIDQITYGPQTENVSEGRLPDGTVTITNFVLSPSPGASNYIASYTGPLLNEVMALNRTAVTNPAGQTPDWAELANPLNTPFDLSGFHLSTAFGNPSQWVFPPGVLIPAHGYLVIWFDNSRPASVTDEAELNTGHAINADSDELYLLNPDGLMVDSVQFGPQAPDFSMGRVNGTWTLLATPTPGATNSPPASLSSASALRLNEWMANPEPGQSDFLELYNTSALPVALGGLYLTDDLSAAGLTKFTIAPLSFIGPHGFTRFKADGDPSQGSDHVSFNLNADAESLRLSSATLGILDTVEFGLQTEGTSEGRLPDGADTLTAFSCPTPALSNATFDTITITAQPQSQMTELGGRYQLPCWGNRRRHVGLSMAF